ncbi:unnamed protein product [Prorocentrum cordatum]|uniref:Uncharacterized protein n=1 Tax=Prorocentrum cordatum TaxID=2364126 RepID=A0ABN9T2J4_9DINO|nr:unnamed protein product [Polarella glacialis]
MRTRSRREEKKEEEQEEEEEEEEAGGERRAAGGGRSSARALCLGCLRAPPPAPQTPAGVGASGERILFRRVAQQRRLTLRGAANSTSTLGLDPRHGHAATAWALDSDTSWVGQP